MATVERITLFNIPKEEHRAQLVEEYKRLVKTAVKDGNPYITNVSFGPALPDPRNRGYNFGVKMTFATLEDLKFYDAECPAHQTFKAFLSGRKEGDVLTVYFENAA
ncbi:hypothetical protein EYB25_007727 [Talaromyces marneffei]|nr:uncharacterized protein EYB26_005262 [Talaromyces marneffei]KAE8549212.1 hypothetical protein EYB25_007727 [Talaromyces marneffei]QGA17591.1 hypothetical protein EYB26_005262 [Talaromyces marneffei]